MKRKCPDCKKTEVTAKCDKAVKKEMAAEHGVPTTVCFPCLRYYDEIERDIMTGHYRGY